MKGDSKSGLRDIIVKAPWKRMEDRLVDCMQLGISLAVVRAVMGVSKGGMGGFI